MPKIDKLILSVKSVLREKYASDFPRVLSLLNKLIQSDLEKGLNTALIFLDDRKRLTSLHLKPIHAAGAKAKDYKNMVDSLYAHYNPDYILIFGAIDVFPQQKLKNLLYLADHEDDQWVASDLPYACNSPYSTDINTFLSPVRVVGRLADINGHPDIDLVSEMINNIIDFKPKKEEEYKPYFAASAIVWRRSSEESVENVFSGRPHVNLVPPKKYHWTSSQLYPLSHFFNCHGAFSDPNWYGQKGGRYPKAMTSSSLIGKIQRNTVVAAECCYGAQLYRPVAEQLPVSMPICNAYFKNGAIAFLGSTSAAYGPSSTNDQADLISQYFMMNILGGASTGRALLEARQKYILNQGPDLSPTDLKTIAQFYLLGDPSLQLVIGKTDAFKKSVGIIEKKIFQDSSRKERRKYLESKGTALAEFVNHLQPATKLDTGRNNKSHLKKLLSEFNMQESVWKTYSIKQNPTNKKTFRSKGMLSSKYHVFLERKQDGAFNQKLLTVKELDGKIVSVRIYSRK
jgi:hypothetical protein